MRAALALIIILIGAAKARADDLTLNAPQPVSGFFSEEYDPAVSPNGRYLAYTSTISGNEDIWINDLQNHRKWNVTANSASDYSPCFRGNEEIIFISTRNNAGGGIFRVDIDGKNLREILGGRKSFDSPVISPDGKSIAFVQADETGFPQILILDIKSGAISHGPVGMDPMYSLSGDKILYSPARLESSVSRGVGIFNIANNSTEILVEGNGAYSDPVFLPDGESILIVRYDEDTDGDGYVTRNDAPSLIKYSLTDSRDEYFYPGFRFGQPFPDRNGRVYVVTDDLDIYSISAYGPVLPQNPGDVLIAASDSLLRSANNKDDSLFAAVVYNFSYRTDPLFNRSSLLVASEIYGALKMTSLARDILKEAYDNVDKDFAGRAVLTRITIDYHEAAEKDGSKAWKIAYGSLRDFVQSGKYGAGVIKDAYLIGIALSHNAGYFDDSNSMIGQALLYFSDDNTFRAQLEMWRLRNFASSYKGDPAMVASYFLDYMTEYSDQTALTDSVINSLTGMTSGERLETATATLETFRGYSDYERLVAAATLEQARRFKEAGRIDLAEWKYSEALLACEDCGKIKFDAFRKMGGIRLAAGDLENAGAYYDSAGRYESAINSLSVKQEFHKNYSYLNTARGYRLLDSNTEEARGYFEKALSIDEGNYFAVWGLARAIHSSKIRVRRSEPAFVFSSENLRAYFDALWQILEFEKRNKTEFLWRSRELLQRSLELDYRYAPAYLSLGYVDCALEAATGNKASLYEEAVEASLSGLKLAGNDSNLLDALHLNLAEAYFGLKRYKESFENFRLAQLRDSISVSEGKEQGYYSKMGEAGYQVDSLAAARNSYEKLTALSVISGNPRMQAENAAKLGLINQESGEYLNAVENYETALPYYLAISDYRKSGDLLKAEAFCYSQQGDFKSAAGAAAKAITMYDREKKRKGTIDEKLRLIIRPLGVKIPLIGIGSMVYGGSPYPYGFSQAADRAYLVPYSIEKGRSKNEISGLREKIALLSDAGEKLKTAGLYNDLGQAFFAEGSLDSAAVSFSAAFEIAIDRKEILRALKFLSNLAIAVVANDRIFEEGSPLLDKMLEYTDDLYGEFLPTDHEARAELRNIKTVGEFLKTVSAMGDNIPETDRGLDTYYSDLDDISQKYRSSLDAIKSTVREGISEISFTEELSLYSSLTLNEAVISAILGDRDSYRASAINLDNAAPKASSARTYARSAAILELLSSTEHDIGKIEEVLSIFESYIPGTLNAAETNIVDALYDSAIRHYNLVSDFEKSLELLERKRNFRAVNLINRGGIDNTEDVLLNAYIRQLRKNQLELIDLRSNERRFEAMGKAGQLGLKAAREDILSLNSRILNLKGKIEISDRNLLSQLTYELPSLRLSMQRINANEAFIAARESDRIVSIWIADSSGIVFAELESQSEIQSYLQKMLKSKKYVTLAANDTAEERIISAIKSAGLEITVKKGFSIGEYYSNGSEHEAVSQGAGIIPCEGARIELEHLSTLKIDTVNINSSAESETGFNGAWLIIDGDFHFDKYSPSLSYWQIKSDSVLDFQSRLKIEDLSRKKLSTFGIILSGFSINIPFAERNAIFKLLNGSGFAAIITISDSLSSGARERFLHEFLEGGKTVRPVEAYRAALRKPDSRENMSDLTEYHGNNGWSPEEIRNIAKSQYHLSMTLGDSSAADGKWQSAAEYYMRADRLSGPAEIDNVEYGEGLVKAVSALRKTREYKQALKIQSRLIDATSRYSGKMIERWLHYRDIAIEARDFDKTRNASLEILRLAENSGNKILTMEALNSLAESSYDLGQYNQSKKIAERAADLAIELSDSLMLAEAYFIKGKCEFAGGLNHNAQTDLEESVRILKSSDSRDLYYRALYTVGEIYTALGKFGDAEKALKEAIGYYLENGDIESLIGARDKLARTYLTAGLPGDAKREIDLILTRNEDDISALLMLGEILFRQGKYPLADSALRRAIAVLGPLGNAANLAKSYETLGDIYYVLGDSMKASNQYILALEFSRRDSTDAGQDLLNYKSATSGFAVSDSVKSRLAAIAVDSRDKFVADLCQLRLADIALSNGDKGQARESIDKIMISEDLRTARILKWRAMLLSAEIGAGDEIEASLHAADSIYSFYPPEPLYLANIYHLQSTGSDIYEELGRMTLQSDLERAVGYFETGALTKAASNHLAAGNFDETEKNFIMDLVERNGNPDYPCLSESGSAANAAYRRLWGNSPVSVSKLRGNLGSGQCVLRFYQTGKNLISFYIDHDTLAYNITDIGLSELTENIRDIGKSLRYSVKADSILEYWYGILIAPFAEMLESKMEVLIVPDGVLYSIPFSAVKMPEADYLGEMYDIEIAAYLLDNYPGGSAEAVAPCFGPENGPLALSIVNSVVEALGGCRYQAPAKINFRWGDFTGLYSQEDSKYICDLEPLCGDDDLLVDALCAARDGNRALIGTLWEAPEQAVSYYYWKFLSDLAAGDGLYESHKGASSYVFGRSRGSVYYWAFGVPFILN